jgi:hypothetical protein
MTLLVIEDAKKLRSRLLLHAGEVRATVQRLPGAFGDFEVKTPTTTASVRGTVFTVLFDVVAAVSVVTVKQGTVAVAPLSGTPVDVTAGLEVVSTQTEVSVPVKPGRAGTPPGAPSRAKAIALVLKRVGRAAAACGLDPLTIEAGAVPADKGWTVTVTTPRGASTWGVVRQKVRPLDDAARELQRRCR